MKNRILFLVSLLILNLPAVFAQGDFTKPLEVAQKFLELYYSGDWYNASKLYGDAECEGQLTYMVMKMETDGNYDDEGKCQFKVDTCLVDNSHGTAICKFTKTCTTIKKQKKSHINLKKVGEKWLVNYSWIRDKFF